MRFHSFDIDPADVDADGLAQSQTPGGAGNLTLNGALISGGSFTDSSGHARQLSITSAGNDSGNTFTVTGTDADGTAITEAITGPNATTVESTRYFKTVSSVAIGAAAVGAITVGTVDELATKTYMLNRYMGGLGNGTLTQYEVTGTINLTAQLSLQDVRNNYTNQHSIPWVATSATALVGATANAIGRMDAGASACRFIVNSYSSGAEVQVYLNEDSGD